MLRKAKLFLTFFFFTSICILQAQNNDIESEWDWFKSLETRISTDNAEELLENKQEELQSAKDIDREDIESKVSKELAFIHIHKTNNLEKAMALLIRALDIEEKAENETALIFTHIGFFTSFLEQVERLFLWKRIL